MRGVIIAGGRGTRLLPLTYTRPKHLLPVANRPFLEYQVALLRDSGVTDIVFATSYFADQIEAHFGDGRSFGVTMHYAVESEPLGTAGAIRNAASLLPADTLLVLNGDVLTDFDLRAILAFHSERDARATVALRPLERPHTCGVVETDPEGRVTAWREPSEEEKRRIAADPGPKTGEIDHINAGIYVFDPEIVASIPSDRPVSVERETYPLLIDRGTPIYGIVPEGYWLDIGHPVQYLRANASVLSGSVKTRVPFRQIGECASIAAGTEIDPTTSVGNNVTIGPGSRLSGCIMMDNVTVGAHTCLTDLIAEDNTHIGDDVLADSRVILTRGSVIGRGARL